MWLRLFLGISLLLVSLQSLARAEPLYVGPVYTTEPGRVSVVVGLPPGSNPTPADFRLMIDDKHLLTAHEMRAFRDAGLGMALAICVDVSGTMSRGPLEQIKKALSVLLKKVRAEDRVALISFADEEELESSFGEPRSHLTKAVDGLKTRGQKTRLYQAIHRSFDRFEDAVLPQRRRIIVISDGKDEGSGGIAADVINKARALNIPIDTVGVGRIEAQYAEALRALSNSTGGYFETTHRDGFTPTAALATIYDDLLRSLVVDFLYTADETGETAQNAWIELQRPGQPLLRVAITEANLRILTRPTTPPPIQDLTPTPSAGSTPTVTPQPSHIPDENLTQRQIPDEGQPGVSKWVWLLGAMLLVVVSLVLWALSAKGPKESTPKPVITPWPASNLDQAPPEPRVDDMKSPQRTQVGGFHFPIPELGQPTAVLLGISGAIKGQRFPIEKEIVHVGAHPDNDWSIVGDEYLSGNHAYLLYKQGRLFIFDKGSTNGTFVNEQEVTTSGFALSLGDHVQLGTSVSELVQALS